MNTAYTYSRPILCDTANTEHTHSTGYSFVHCNCTLSYYSHSMGKLRKKRVPIFNFCSRKRSQSGRNVLSVQWKSADEKESNESKGKRKLANFLDTKVARHLPLSPLDTRAPIWGCRKWRGLQLTCVSIWPGNLARGKDGWEIKGRKLVLNYSLGPEVASSDRRK